VAWLLTVEAALDTGSSTKHREYLLSCESALKDRLLSAPQDRRSATLWSGWLPSVCVLLRLLTAVSTFETGFCLLLETGICLHLKTGYLRLCGRLSLRHSRRLDRDGVCCLPCLLAAVRTLRDDVHDALSSCCYKRACYPATLPTPSAVPARLLLTT